MPQATRDIQRRLKSVNNIRKITRAMELVAAAKMRKSVSRVLSSRAYADAAWNLVMELVPKVEQSEHPLLQERPVKRVAMIVIASNRGLCGSFNLAVVNTALRRIEKEGWKQANIPIDFFTFGKRSAQILAGLNKNIASDYPKDDITDDVGDVLPIAREIIQSFIAGQYDEVCVSYTHFFSSLRQEARIRYLLPLVKPSRFLGHLQKDKQGTDETSTFDFSEYFFEPSRSGVLKTLLPRLVELQLYQMVLESEASEHSARMMAMRNATESATDMLDSLTLAFNQARQAGITAELAEIAAGSVVAF